MSTSDKMGIISTDGSKTWNVFRTFHSVVGMKDGLGKGD